MVEVKDIVAYKKLQRKFLGRKLAPKSFLGNIGEIRAK